MKVKLYPFYEDIIGIIAEDVFKTNIKPNEILLIAPSKRFFHYFAENLKSKYENSYTISPDLTTISDLLKEIISNTGKYTGNEFELIGMLIKAIKETEGFEKIIYRNNFDTYSGVISVARKFLKIFGEINREKIDFTNKDYLNQIIETNKDVIYTKFSDHLNVLQNIYRNYYSLQKENDIFDPTFLIKDIKAKEIEEYFKKYSAVILISPLALTDFEQTIFKTIEDKLTIIIQETEDFDFSSIRKWPVYRINPNILKQNDKKRPEIFYSEEASLYHEVSKTISIIEDEVNNGTELNEIVVVNIDSTFSEMLYESLNSYGIPANLSQGFSVKNTPVYSFFNNMKLYFDTKKSYYLLNLISNPVFSDLCGIKIFPYIYARIKKEIVSDNNIQTFNTKDLFKDFHEISNLFERLEDIYNEKNTDAFRKKIIHLIGSIKNKNELLPGNLSDEIVDLLYNISAVSNYLDFAPVEQFISTLSSINITELGSYKIGVQILGLLETRGISFKTVIVPSFNEGNFPSPSDEYIFFNSQLRKALGLPGLYQQELLEYFYLKRLIDSSKRAYIMSLSFESSNHDIPSRFLYLYEKGTLKGTKLKHTIPFRQHKSVKPNETNFNFLTPVLDEKTTSYSRLDIERIKTCEVKYYIEKILHISEEEELTEEIDRRIIGIKIHKIFNELYSDNRIDKIDNKKREEFHNLLDTLFEKHLYNDTFFTNAGPIVIKILKSFSHTILENDLNRFLNLGYRPRPDLSEKDFKAKLMDTEYEIWGKIDRVDESPDRKFIIIDYKTGKIPEKNELTEKKDYQEIQLGIYGILIRKNYPENKIESLAYYDIGNTQELKIVINESEMDDYLMKLENHIIDILDKIKNKTHLQMTDETNNCVYCPYKYICRIIENES